MENRIRVMCFLPLVLSVIVTIFNERMNKEPPIDCKLIVNDLVSFVILSCVFVDESYQRMPPLFKVDDYDECMKKNGAQFCVVNIVIEKDKTSDLWRQIEVSI